MAKIKLGTDTPDYAGRYPEITCSPSATLKEIWSYLWEHNGGEGYKFGMVFDCSKDEYEDIEEFNVFYLDELDEEVKAYKGG